jgi:hypothetical protein
MQSDQKADGLPFATAPTLYLSLFSKLPKDNGAPHANSSKIAFGTPLTFKD